jgi:hypothetical protein
MALVLAGIAAQTVAAAPHLICHPIAPGETMTSLSLRLTEDPQGWRSDAFQVLDPAGARFISKADYRLVHPGLQACIVEPMFRGAALPGRDWWLLLLACSVAAAVSFVVVSSMDRRKASSAALQTFGAAFIREFERPLVDERQARSVLRSELVVSRDRCSIEVLLAPAGGQRYPNLADHRTNVEYDVERVMSFLNDRRFTRGPLRARGVWVAIPFQMASDVRKEGGA